MPRTSSLGWIGALFLIVLGATGCSRRPENAQLAAMVQNRIRGDQRLQMARIQVLATNGVVTLSGYVGNSDQRTATVQDASQIEGVRVVVDNLRTDDVAAGSPATVSQNPSATLHKPAPTIALTAKPSAAWRTLRTRSIPAALPDNSPYHPNPPQNTSVVSTPAAPASTPVAATPVSSEPPSVDSNAGEATPTWPAPTRAAMNSPAPPEQVEIPDGTVLTVRLTESLSSELNDKGDTFLASLASPITLGDRVVVPADAEVQGRVVEVQSAGRFSGRPGLVIEVTRLAYNGQSYELNSSQYSKQGASRTTRTAATIGGGAGVGALIGGILGGGRGAAIGAMIGAGTGAGVQASGKPAEVQLPAESMVSFRLQNPLTVIPSSTLQGIPGGGSDSQDSSDRPVLKRRPGSPPAEQDSTDQNSDGPGAMSPSDQGPEDSPSPPDPN